MNFEHTQERRMLADSLERFLAENYRTETRNRLAYGAEGRSAALYAQLAGLGVIGALLPEDAGGYAGSGFDIGVVFEAAGRWLLAEPLLGALLVGRTLAAAGSQAQQALLPGIIDGTTVAALAHDEPGSHYELHNVSASARRSDGGWLLQGAKGVVAWGEQADLLLVSARTAGGPSDEAGISLFLVPGAARGIGKRGYHRIDGGRAAELTFDHVALPADTLLGGVGQGLQWLEFLQGYALLALAAEAVGAMDAARQQTLEYLRTRRQFGAPIGSFQALQHRMADMLLEIEQARSAVINAAAAIDGADPLARERALSAAKYSVGRAATLVAEESIQMHGGIGMTWELPLSHYAKRLVMLDHQFGDEDHHLARFIRLNTYP